MSDPGRTPTEAPRLPLPIPGNGFVVGRGESVFLGGGWHDREVRAGDHVACRAIGPRAEFRLRLRRADRSVKVLMTVPVSMIGTPWRGRLRMGDDVLAEWTVASEAWALRTAPLPATSVDREAVLVLESETWVVPARVLPGSLDTRPLAGWVGAVLAQPCAAP